METRSGSKVEHAGRRFTIYPGDVPQDESFTSQTWDDALVWSKGHYGYPNFPPISDIGGSFNLGYNRQENGSCGVGTVQGGTAYAEYRYSGKMYAVAGWTGGSPASVDPSNLGSTAYRKMKPDKPNMNAALAIYELKDVPEMLRQRFTGSGLHEIGDYYLALKFGWQPLLNDVRSFVNTQMNAQGRLQQLIRDEGRPVKRKVTLSDSTSDVYVANGTGNFLGPSLVSYFYADAGRFDATVRSSSRIWANARFRYWLPPGPRDIDWTNDMKNRIFGLYPSPSQVYQAIPWTWLAGWFTNVGDMIDNCNTTLTDRCAADYFYMMSQQYYKGELTLQSTMFRENTLEKVPVSASSSFERGSKVRLTGDPFGYGTPENSLSGVQLSIMGALGLSRLR